MGDNNQPPFPPAPASDKAPWQSKTIWVALLGAIAAFCPPVQHFISGNPETYALVLSGLFSVLRIVTKDKISIS